MKIRTVIIGMGKMGRLRHRIMERHGGFEIVGICDPVKETMAGYETHSYTDWKECIDKEEPELIFACAINKVIPEIVCYALERDIHVFSEKPPGRNFSDARRMREIAEKSAASLKFGFNHRYHNSVMEAKALVDSGALGEIVCIRGVYGKAGNDHFKEEWRNDLSLSGGGILLDQGIHMLDLIIYLMGPMEIVDSLVNNLVWKELPTEDSALVMMKTQDGRVASLHSSAIQWKHKFDMDIICENGFIALNGILTSTESYGEETITYYRKDLGQTTGKLGKPMEHTLCFDSDESWDYEIAEMYQVVREGAHVKMGTPKEAERIMQTIETIYEKAKETA